MSRCEQCGYQWPDVDEEGNLISAPYCHYEGPDEWAPCAQDEYDYGHEPYPDEEEYEELGSMYDLDQDELDEVDKFNQEEYQKYEKWLASFNDEEPTFEEYGAPYDYKEF